MLSKHYDCVIIGAGPAGSAAATLLAQGGRSVLIADKASFPRFHIGESLIPAGNRVLKKMGAWPAIENANFVKKYGAEFITGDGTMRVHNCFRNGLIKGLETTYQVERARFDHILLRRACQAGATLLQPAEAKSAVRKNGQWQLTLNGPDGTQTIETPWLLDAAGRGRWLGRQLGIGVDAIALPKRFAVYNHFHGVRRAKGEEAGNILITRIANGWFWTIPLDDERTSVGLVTTRDNAQATPEEQFHREVEASAHLRRLMKNAQPVETFRVESDYSYLHQQFSGEGWFLLGDAAGFIDPVFSSGVYLALESADLAANHILNADGTAAPDITAYERKLRQHMGVMLDMVKMFYDVKAFSVFMNPSNRFQLFAAVNSVVAGCTEMPFALRWRYALFLAICKLNRKLPLVPPVKL